MTLQLHRVWCLFFMAGSFAKDIKNGAAVTSLRTFARSDAFTLPAPSKKREDDDVI